MLDAVASAPVDKAIPSGGWNDPPQLADIWHKFDVPRQGLERVRRLLSVLGEPQNELSHTIHIAGTNGKGSVLAFCNAILRAAGIKPNAFVSPHLISATERIRIHDHPVSPQRLLDLIAWCDRDDAPVSYFECLTAAMFEAARAAAPTWTILETGLGGRLDSTNLIPCPSVAIISTIGMDHQAYLGSTLAEIAAEKAGIIKSGGLVVSAQQESAAAEVVTEAARQRGAQLLMNGRDFFVESLDDCAATGISVRFAGHYGAGEFTLPAPSLLGAFQRENAALAAVAVRSVAAEVEEHSITDAAIRAGIASARWRGRLDRLRSGAFVDSLPPTWSIWLDGAHNPMGMSRLGEFILASGGEWVAIMAILRTKNLSEILATAAGIFSRVYCYGDGIEFHGTESLHEQARRHDGMVVAGGDLASAVAAVRADYGGEEVNLMMTGSLHLVGEVLRRSGVMPQDVL